MLTFRIHLLNPSKTSSQIVKSKSILSLRLLIGKYQGGLLIFWSLTNHFCLLIVFIHQNFILSIHQRQFLCYFCLSPFLNLIIKLVLFRLINFWQRNLSGVLEDPFKFFILFGSLKATKMNLVGKTLTPICRYYLLMKTSFK